MSFGCELDGWDPMREAYLLDRGCNKNNMNNNRQFPMSNQGVEVEDNKLYVKGIPKHTEEVALKNFFKKCGKVLQVNIIKPQNDNPTTYGFVTYASHESAINAIRVLSGQPPFRFELSFARKKFEKKGNFVKPSPDVGNVFNPTLSPAGVAAENNAKQTSPSPILQVITSQRGRDVQYNSQSGKPKSQLPAATNNNNNNDDESWETNTNQNNSSSGQVTSLTATSHLLPNLPNPVQVACSAAAPYQLSNNSNPDQVNSLTGGPLHMLNLLNPGKGSSPIVATAVSPQSHNHLKPAHAQNSSPTAASHKFQNHTNPVKVHQPQSVLSPNNNISSELNRTDYSSMPFLSTYEAFCFDCGRRGILCCSACRMPYCSPECQRADWQNHKEKCSKYAFYFDRTKYKQDENAAVKKDSKKVPEDGITAVKNDANKISDAGINTTNEAFSQKNQIGKKPKPSPNNKQNIKVNHVDGNRPKNKNFRKSESPSPNEKHFPGGDNAKFGNFPHKNSSAPSHGFKAQPSGSRLTPVDSRSQHPDSRAQASDFGMHPVVPSRLKASSLTFVSLCVDRNEEVVPVFMESIRKFWLQKVSNASALKEITDELQSLSASKSLLPSPEADDLCAAEFSEDGCLYRARITEVKDGLYCVYYVDFGNSETVPAGRLYNLNEKLTSYPFQAVCCKLGGIKPPSDSTEWRAEDFAEFKRIATNPVETWEARVIKSVTDKYEVDLVSNGVSITALLVEGHRAVYIEEEPVYPTPSRVNQPSTSNLSKEFTKVPTVFTQLLAGSTLTLMPVFETLSGVYVHVVDGQLLAQYGEMQSSLDQEASKLKDISSSVQKHEFAVAHSAMYKSYFRCFVVNQERNRCRIRYVDYGNEEEVDRLLQLDSPFLDTPSPLIFCDFSQLSSSDKEQVKKLEKFEGSVIETTDGMMFNILYNVKPYCVKLLPWWHGLSDSDVLPNNVIFAAEETELPTSGETTVNVVWANADGMVFVQKASLAQKILSLSTELEEYCNSVKECIVPTVGDMVCSLFVDNKWYRSRVTEIFSSDECEVFFVDYGNEARVKFENIRRLPAKYTSPVSCCSCVSVPGVQSVTSEISEIMCEGLWELQVINPSVTPVVAQLSRGGKDLLSILVSQKLITTSQRKKYPYKELREFESSPVKVEYVDDDKCLVLHLVCEESKLLLMQQQLNMKLQSSQIPLTYVPTVDDVVCAQFSKDDLWYRGLVTDVKGPDTYKVLFVDYGNTDEVPHEKIRSLPDQFLNVPVFCLKVLLHNVPAEFVNCGVGNLLKDSYKLSFVDTSSKPIKVEMFMNGRSLNQEIRNRFAPQSQKLASHRGTDLSPVLNEKPQSAQENSHVEIKDGEIETFSESKEEVIPLVDIPTGTNINLYVHNIYAADMIFIAPHDVKGDTEFSKFQSELQIYSKRVKEHHIPEPEEIVLAQNPCDGKWYRGAILGVDDNLYETLFVDLGLVMHLPKESLKKIDMKFMEFPQQSVFCKLFGVAINEDNREKIKQELLHAFKTPCHVGNANVYVIDGEYVVDFPSFRNDLINKGFFL